MFLISDKAALVAHMHMQAIAHLAAVPLLAWNCQLLLPPLLLLAEVQGRVP